MLVYPPLKADVYDQIIFVIFCATAMKCLLCSTLFHVHHCHHNHRVYRNLCCLDYIGISALICGSFCLFTYYGFYCQRPLRMFYLTILVALGIAGMAASAFPAMYSKKHRVLRTVLFVLIGVFSSVPAFHYLAAFELPKISGWGLHGWVAVAVIYLLGAFIYAYRIPER